MKTEPSSRSLSEVHESVSVPKGGNILRRIFAIAGPAYLVSVGYMDPGNWATDLAAGSSFNYSLLWVLLMSNLMAVLLQALSARLGIVRGLDLAQACRTTYPRPVNLSLYALCELAITATDLAEVLGSAIALQLLFGLPLVWGVLITAGDTLALLFLSHLGIRKIEAVIISLITVIGVSFFVELALASPDWGGVAGGLVPSMPNSTALFIAIGMLGATVMPHNLYLHSALVQTRRIGPTDAEKKQAIRLNTVDSAVALNMAFFVNAAILIMAAAVFHRSGHTEVAEIQDAHRLLNPLLGAAIAPVAFAVALLASGQSSTITGTLAGQIVMEGFLSIRISPWARRLITRLLAVVPAVITVVVFGDAGTGMLLVLSQVVLSLQLPFAIIPLVHFVSDRKAMGRFAIGPWVRALAWICALIVVGLNGKLVVDTLGEWMAGGGSKTIWLSMLLAPLNLYIGGLLVYVTLHPWLMRARKARRAALADKIHKGMATDLSVDVSTYGKVAIALDFSGGDAEVLRETLRFLGGRTPELVLMHVTESAGARYLGRDSGDQESLDDAEMLEAFATELRGRGLTVSTRLGAGKRVQSLAKIINEEKPDLVVLGAHGHRFFLDMLLGSTADALRHLVDASVLVVAKGRTA